MLRARTLLPVVLGLMLVGAPATAAPGASPKPAAQARSQGADARATRRGHGGGRRVTRAPTRGRPLVTLFHINHRETVRLRLGPGQPPARVVRQVSRLLRCHHTNKGRRIHPRLARLLYETGRHFPGRRIEVVSGYRHPSVSRNPGSLHMKGEACDLRVSGVDNAQLRDFLRRTFDKIGVGYYPNSSFVHLDIRPSGRAFWVDYSGPGENALYARQPTLGLNQSGGRGARTIIDPSWAFATDDEPARPAGNEGGSAAAGPE